MFHILIVDDDAEIREMLCAYLEKKHFKATAFEDGERLLNQLSINESYDLIILDVNMPGLDGLEVCKLIRSKGNDIPILMLTCLSEDIDRIIGLELGADDYLTKPFNARELLARIKSILKRSKIKVSNNLTTYRHYKFNYFTLDNDKRVLLDEKNKEIKLTTAIYTLLLIFLENPNRVLTRENLLDEIGDQSIDVLDRSIDVKIGRLRKKLNKHSKYKPIIETVRGGGYILNSEVQVIGKSHVSL